MTPDEFRAKFRAIKARRNVVIERIAEQARAVLPLMKDHNLTNSAKPLDESFFELDAIQQEAMELAKENPMEMITYITRAFSE